MCKCKTLSNIKITLFKNHLHRWHLFRMSINLVFYGIEYCMLLIIIGIKGQLRYVYDRKKNRPRTSFLASPFCPICQQIELNSSVNCLNSMPFDAASPTLLALQHNQHSVIPFRIIFLVLFKSINTQAVA